MSKMIRIYDEKLYKLLTLYAKETDRGISNAGEHLLKKYLLEWDAMRKTKVVDINDQRSKYYNTP